MKFKVGDRVRVRQWDDMAKEFGVNKSGQINTPGIEFYEEKKKFCGKILEIKGVVEWTYHVSCSANSWIWLDCMLENYTIKGEFMFKVKVGELYGKRLKNVILYGSYARGEATDDSDIDMAVVLEGDISPGREIDRMIDIITDMNLKHNILISIYPVSEIDYLTLKSPLLMNVRKEGVPT